MEFWLLVSRLPNTVKLISYLPIIYRQTILSQQSELTKSYYRTYI